jgi:8-oxo-dGTP pyrophosphatase MutT (NUDIX family)
VYITPDKKVLLSDEYIAGQMFTKFVGGGLELGEGLRDCLERECLEELNTKVRVTNHIYTTDFFQPSAFRQGDQIISIYYRFEPLEPLNVEFRDKQFDFDELKEDAQIFRLVPLQQFTEDDVTFPIDKIVAKMIREFN